MESNYEEIYREMGINVEPIGVDYNPEEYGRELMRGMQCTDEVVYSSSTSYNPKADNEIKRAVFA